MGNKSSKKKENLGATFTSYSSFNTEINRKKSMVKQANVYNLTFGQKTELSKKDSEILNNYIPNYNTFVDVNINVQVLAYNLEDVYLKYIEKIEKNFYTFHMSLKYLSSIKDDYSIIIPYLSIKKPHNYTSSTNEWKLFSKHIYHTYYSEFNCQLVEKNIPGDRAIFLSSNNNIINLLDS
tara:strand:- start:2709 stop:3248 length:540 start_codon:yes stop_codon:yes gene_type:complete